MVHVPMTGEVDKWVVFHRAKNGFESPFRVLNDSDIERNGKNASHFFPYRVQRRFSYRIWLANH